MSERRVEIFCPKCKWRPVEGDRWQCYCGNVWNTFNTNGTCPDCGETHKDTQCLACGKWSLHQEWYHEFNSNREEAKESLVIKTKS